MNANYSKSACFIKSGLCAALAAVTGLQAGEPPQGKPSDRPNPKAAALAAWTALEKAMLPYPGYHDRAAVPIFGRWEAYRLTVGDQAIRVADQARDLYGRFPLDAHADEARTYERQALSMAAQFGRTDGCDRLDALDAPPLAKPNLPEAQRFRLVYESAKRRLAAACFADNPSAMAKAESAVRSLFKAYPDKSEVQSLTLQLAAKLPPDQGKPLAQELLQHGAQGHLNRVAQDILAGKAPSKSKP